MLAHFDHQLRDDSFTETELLEKYCHQRGIKFLIKNGLKNCSLLKELRLRLELHAMIF